MSQDNVEVVRAYAEAYNAGRDAFVDFLVDFMAEDVEIVPDASRFPEAKPFRGREEYRRYIADIDQDWEGGGRSEIKEIFPWEMIGWLFGSTGAAGAGPAASTCAPASVPSPPSEMGKSPSSSSSSTTRGPSKPPGCRSRRCRRRTSRLCAACERRSPFRSRTGGEHSMNGSSSCSRRSPASCLPRGRGCHHDLECA